MSKELHGKYIIKGHDNMIKKIVVSASALMLLIASASCESKKKQNYNNSAEVFNDYYYVRMDDSIIYRENSIAYLLDCESMDTAVLCNIPNCSHNSSDCIIKNLAAEEQLPVIYNNNAYYFVNSNEFIEKDGKLALELSCKLKKYSFADREFSDVAEINDFNANVSSGCYLIGSEYYFTTNIGNPLYDEAGNVSNSNTGGGGDLFSINLDSGKVTDYGAIFDYEALKAEYPDVRDSLSMFLMGKIDNKLYIGINYAKQNPTPEILEKYGKPIFSGETYTFDLDTHKIELLDNYFSMCTMNDYHSYYSGEQNKTITLQNVKTGEIFNGPDIISWNAMTIFGDKVWHDDAKCFDIKTGEETKVSSYDSGLVIAEYKDSYIFMDDSNGKTVFEKLPKSDF